MIGKKITLGALVIALSSGGCKMAINENMPAKQTTNFPQDTRILQETPNGSFDSIDDYVDTENLASLLDSTYFIMSESQYENPSGKIETFHSLGSAVLYKDIKERTYLVTANHVVDNEEEIFDFLGRKYKKKSETFYLLEDYQVNIIHRALRIIRNNKHNNKFYFKDESGITQELNHVVKTSDALKVLLPFVRPRHVRVDAANDPRDIAIISVKDLSHKPIIYSVGDTRKLQPQNLVYVTGWPLGLVKNLNRGHVTSVNDSYLVGGNPTSRFIHDASISPGNSGGGIFAVEKGNFKFIGFTSAMYRGGNDLYIGIKINAVSDVFKGNSITCSKNWECNKSLTYEIKL